MKEMGLHSGDLMVVDKTEKPLQGDIVIAETDGEFTVKRLQLTPRIALTCETNPSSFSQIMMAASLREVLKRSGWASKWGYRGFS